jgi:amidohydrolase
VHAVNPAELIANDRRALHRIPEVGLELPLTTAYCVQTLEGFGLTPRPCGDGLVVDLGDAGPLFAWRADMDALPVQEETGLAFASEFPGRMHACGHDAHMATALGIARHYTRGGGVLPCRLRLILQPGEEGYDGALRMIEAGALEGVKAISGLHVGCIFPELPQGRFGTRKGTVMASATFFSVTFRGKGSHGAFPNQGSDALLAACQFVSSLQSVRYGAASPVHPTVISIGSIQAGSAANVLPEEAVVSGTMRTTTWDDLASMIEHFERQAQASALARGVTVAIRRDLRAPITANTDHAMADMLADAVVATHGPDSFQWLADATLVGEDFGAFLEKVPGVFFFLGTGDKAPHHHPRFDLEDGELHRAVPVLDALLQRWAAREAGVS